MRAILILLFSLFTVIAQAAPGVNALQIGNSPSADNASYGLPYSRVGNLVIITAGVQNTGAGGHYAFTQAGHGLASQVLYRPPAGKHFRVLSAYGASSAAGNRVFLLGHSTTAATEGGAEPASSLRYGAAATSGTGVLPPSPTSGTLPIPQLVGMTFPSSSYIWLRYPSASEFFQITLTGEEVDN